MDIRRSAHSLAKDGVGGKAGPYVADHPFVTRLNGLVPLDDNDLTALAPILGRNLVVKKGRDIVRESYVTRGIYIVKAGFAIRYKLLHNGKRQVLGLTIPGDIVGFPASLFKTAFITAVGIENVSLHRVAHDEFATICLARPAISAALLWVAACEAEILAEHITDIGRRAPIERLAHFLLETHARLRAVGLASASSFEVPLTQEMIGDAIGLSSTHVNRVLAELKREGLVSSQKRTFKLLDVDGLHSLAEFRSLFSSQERPLRPGSEVRIPNQP